MHLETLSAQMREIFPLPMRCSAVALIAMGGSGARKLKWCKTQLDEFMAE